MTSITITRGDSQRLVGQVTLRATAASAAIPLDISDPLFEFRFTAKSSLNDLDASAVIRKGTTNTGLVGITLTDAVHGIYEIRLLPADTAALSSTTTSFLFFDVQMKEPDGAVTTVDQGRLAVAPDVTRTA